MDSPPAKVLYDELPEQSLKVVYDAETSPSRNGSTPKRKTRVAKGRQSHHTGRHGHSESREKESREKLKESTHKAPAGPAPRIPPPFWDDHVGDEDVNVDNGPAGTCTQGVEELVQDTALAYPGFVEAVLSDECSFYQLSQKTFVANGWDSVKNEANVRVVLPS